MSPSIDVTQEGIIAMASELSRLSGQAYAPVLRQMAAQVAKSAALDSNIASKAAIERQVRERSNTTKGAVDLYGGATEEYALTTNMRKAAGRVWFIQKSTGKAYMIFDGGPTRGHHVPNVIWSFYLYASRERGSLINAKIKDIVARRGIERVSWLQIGDGLGVPLASVSPQGNLNEPLARGANVRGRQFQNGSARETTSGPQHIVAFTNASPVAIKRGGQERTDRGIRNQLRTFEIACQRGYIEDLTFRSKRWPGVFVQAA